ncbi:hypothetical protein [Marinobacter sp. V034]|uniref:hypothetical protein n=1 Tax=Marinobacter sp. V034 TaxID=3459610 RepID=UPI0040446F68
MKRIYLFLTMLLLSTAGCADSEPTIQAVFSGVKFNIPNNPLIVGNLGQNNDLLIVKYSRELGKQYIGFSKERDIDTGGCTADVFFETTIEDDDADTKCSGTAIDAFRKVFVEGASYGQWKGKKREYYFFLKDEKPSFIFYTLTDGSVIKLESDFMDKQGFREMLGAELN